MAGTRRRLIGAMAVLVAIATGGSAAAGPWTDARAARLLEQYGYDHVEVADLREGQKIALTMIEVNDMSRAEVRAHIASTLGRGLLGLNRRR